MPSSASFFSAIPIGIRYVLISALGFAFMAAVVKWVSMHGIPVFEIVAGRALVSLIISYLDVKRKGISIWGNNRKLLFARGLVGTLALVCVYYSVTTIPLAEATILQYTYPIFTAIWAVVLLKERIHITTIICIALSVAGLVCMMQPKISNPSLETLPTLSIIAALTGALGSSIAYIIVRKLSQTEDSSVIIVYFPLIALPVSLILMGHNFVMPNLLLTIMLVLVGVLTQVGQWGLTNAMKTMAASKTSAYSYVQILFTALIGYFLFDEIPSYWTYIGGGLIISGAIVNLFGSTIATQLKRS